MLSAFSVELIVQNDSVFSGTHRSKMNSFAHREYDDSFHGKRYPLRQIQNLTFLGTNSNSIKSQFEFVPRDTEESEFLDVVGFGGAALSVETGT